MPKKSKRESASQAHDESAAALVRAAKTLVGDDGAPLTDEEAAIVADLKAKHGRPGLAEIRARAKRLADKD